MTEKTKVTTRDCVDALIKWSTDNYEHLADPEYWNFIGEARLTVVRKGHTRVSNWKRRAIKKDGNTTYRLFTCVPALFPLGTYFLVTQIDDEITQIDSGIQKTFTVYFDNINY